MKSQMPAAVKESIAAHLIESRRRRTEPERDDVWRPLEEAHILSQPWAWPHIRVHGAMLVEAVRQRDRREMLGQVVRLIVAGPGSLSSRYPVGNTGRANVPLQQTMPVPEDLAALLRDP